MFASLDDVKRILRIDPDSVDPVRDARLRGALDAVEAWGEGSFSLAKAGDSIDRSVGQVTGEVATRIRTIKEESLDLSSAPRNKYENALHVYYDDVILSLVEGLRGALAETKNMPRIDRAIPIRSAMSSPRAM